MRIRYRLRVFVYITCTFIFMSFTLPSISLCFSTIMSFWVLSVRFCNEIIIINFMSLCGKKAAWTILRNISFCVLQIKRKSWECVKLFVVELLSQNDLDKDLNAIFKFTVDVVYSFLTSDTSAADRIFLSSLRFLLMIIAMETGLSWKRPWSTRFVLTQDLNRLHVATCFFLICLLPNDSEAATQILKGNDCVASCRQAPASSSWSCGCCAGSGSLSPSRSGCVGDPTGSKDHETSRWPETRSLH